MSSLSGLNSDFLKDFLTSLLHTLISSGKQKLLTVSTEKRVYDPSEAVKMNALLIDQSGSPVSDAMVDVNISKEGNRKVISDIQLNEMGNGSYAGSVTGLGEGRYFYSGRASSSSGVLGADSGTIAVEPLNTEFVQTSMNAQLLRRLSSVTGGTFMTSSEFLHRGLAMQPEWQKPVRLTNVNSFEWLSSLPILAVVLILLSIEWVMRKILGLP